MIGPLTNWSRNLTDESSIQKNDCLVDSFQRQQPTTQDADIPIYKRKNPQMLNQVGV